MVIFFTKHYLATFVSIKDDIKIQTIQVVIKNINNSFEAVEPNNASICHII